MLQAQEGVVCESVSFRGLSDCSAALQGVSLMILVLILTSLEFSAVSLALLDVHYTAENSSGAITLLLPSEGPARVDRIVECLHIN